MKNNENNPQPDFGVFTPNEDISAMSGELMDLLSQALGGNEINGEIYRSIYCVELDLVDISKSPFNPERLIKRVQTVTLASDASQAFYDVASKSHRECADEEALEPSRPLRADIRVIGDQSNATLVLDRDCIESVRRLVNECDGITVSDVFTQITGIDSDYLGDGSGDFGWLVNGKDVGHHEMGVMMLASLYGKDRYEINAITNIVTDALFNQLNHQNSPSQ